MRLGDLDALRDVIIGYRPSAIWDHPTTDAVKEIVDELVEAVDAAPTVDCAACEFNDAKTGSRRWQRCAGCYGACNFKRRQP